MKRLLLAPLLISLLSIGCYAREDRNTYLSCEFTEIKKVSAGEIDFKPIEENEYNEGLWSYTIIINEEDKTFFYLIERIKNMDLITMDYLDEAELITFNKLYIKAKKINYLKDSEKTIITFIVDRKTGEIRRNFKTVDQSKPIEFWNRGLCRSFKPKKPIS